VGPARAILVATGEAEEVSHGHAVPMTGDLLAHGLKAIEDLVDFRGFWLAVLANPVE
jgi:hypothetical protein